MLQKRLGRSEHICRKWVARPRLLLDCSTSACCQGGERWDSAKRGKRRRGKSKLLGYEALPGSENRRIQEDYNVCDLFKCPEVKPWFFRGTRLLHKTAIAHQETHTRIVNCPAALWCDGRVKGTLSGSCVSLCLWRGVLLGQVLAFQGPRSSLDRDLERADAGAGWTEPAEEMTGKPLRWCVVDHHSVPQLSTALGYNKCSRSISWMSETMGT